MYVFEGQGRKKSLEEIGKAWGLCA